MLLFHWVVTAVGCATTVRQPWWAGVLSFVVIFAFWGINYIAVELEQPFGDDPNDLPLHDMQADLNKSLIALLHPCAQHAPDFNFNKEEHIVCRRSNDHMEAIDF